MLKGICMSEMRLSEGRNALRPRTASLWILTSMGLGAIWMACGSDPVATRECTDGATEQLLCDDGQGQRMRHCEHGRWTQTSCDPGAVCTSGSEQRTACPEGGSQVETCVQERWKVERTCGASCTAGSQENEACGHNHRGNRTSSCGDNARWQSTACDDPDECRDDATQDIACGAGGRQTQRCTDGVWHDEGNCERECKGTGTSTAVCGLNDRGAQEVQCVDEKWVPLSDCIDPDECLDHEIVALACEGGLGRRDQTCVIGQWQTSACSQSHLHGGSHSDGLLGLGFCALNHLGQALCWGSNREGQLGIGNKESPVEIQNAVPSQRFQSVAYGNSHSCGVDVEGDVYCWGDNTNGQLGNESTISSVTPVKVVGISNAQAVAASARHTCALVQAGELYCWGLNDQGQLGNDSTTNRQSATKVLNLNNIVSVVAGGNSTCAIDAAGQLFCWGGNESGQLGTGNTANKKIPYAISSMNAVSNVSVSSGHTCAIHQHRVYCWGANTLGELGTGNTTDRRTPVQTTLTVNARQVAVGHKSTCAVLVDGGIACWGNNYSGEMGRGTRSAATAANPDPTRIGNFTKNVEIAISSRHLGFTQNTVCAMKEDGGLYCWGARVAGSIPPPGELNNVVSPLAIPVPSF